MISSISDVHIKKRGDDREQLLLSFFSHDKVKISRYVFLLGDIFDLMVGDHKEYLEQFSHVFEGIVKLCQQGKRVYFFEGNHDFLLAQLFNYFSVKNRLGSNFFFSPSDIQMTIDGREFYWCHGDNIEIENPKYKIYKRLINNNVTNFLANNVVPYRVIKQLGDFASAKSRLKNQKKYDLDSSADINFIKNKFRISADLVKSQAPEVDFIISGHSHVEDLYKSEKGYTYINNGFVPKTKQFVFLDNDLIPELIKI